MGDGMYEVTRLAATIYSLLVIFPISPLTAPFVGLATRLKRELSQLDMCNRSLQESKLLVWILVMGGIAATHSAERMWFVIVLKDISNRMALSTWNDVKGLVQAALWLESTNDADGMALWLEVESLSFSGHELRQQDSLQTFNA